MKRLNVNGVRSLANGPLSRLYNAARTGWRASLQNGANAQRSGIRRRLAPEIRRYIVRSRRFGLFTNNGRGGA